MVAVAAGPQAAAFYASRPWRDEYGSGASGRFQALPYDNLAQMMDAACREYGGHTAFTTCLPNGTAGSLRYAEVAAHAQALAAYLREDFGLRPGDRVAVQSPNCLAYPVATYAVFLAGAVVVNVNPLYTAEEMQKQLADSGARLLFIVDMFRDKLEQGLADTAVEQVLQLSVADFFAPLKRTLVRTVQRLRGQVPRSPRPTVALAEALGRGQRRLAGGRLEPVPRRPQDLAVLQYTGGTTGRAKGARLSHANLMANIAQIDAICGSIVHRGEDVALTALPLYHIFAFSFNMLFFFHAGGHNVLCPSPRPIDNLKPIFERYRITKTTGVNALFLGLLHADWFRHNPPRSLDLVVSGGTALHRSVAERWQALLGLPLLEGYGLSETSPVLAVNPPMGENRLGTIGIPLPGTEIELRDDDGQAVPPGEPGELVARGPQVMDGYHERPEETAAVLQDGWFRTGDVAVMDERGYLRIVDRKKDMIDVSGFNVYPNEVEDVLTKHPGINEVAVVGVPLREGGEKVRAYVSRSDPGLTEQAVIAYAREHLTGYKVPRQVVFRDELPKTPVGKVLRRQLRDEAKAERDTA